MSSQLCQGKVHQVSEALQIVGHDKTALAERLNCTVEEIATAIIELTHTLSPLVEEAQQLTALVSEHLDILVSLAETGIADSKITKKY